MIFNVNDDIKPLCIKLPQMDASAKSFKDSKKMSFKVIYKKYLKKYTLRYRKILAEWI